jgi:hypothetical protein
MVTMEGQKETSSWYSCKLDIVKKFAVVQVEWADQAPAMMAVVGLEI